MFIVGFLLLLTIAYGEIFNFRKISNHLMIKNLLTAVFVGGGFLVTVGLALWQSLEVSDTFAVFKDWRLYFGMSLEIFGVWLTRKNYEINSSSITSINFSLFFSIILVPILSFYGSSLFDFDRSIKLNYKSEMEMLMFLLAFLVLMIVYFADKVKGHVNNIFILFLLPFSLSFSLFWTTKMMQVYQGIVYYGAIGLALLTFFLIQMIKSKEWRNYKRENNREVLIIASVSSVILPLNILAVKFLAVEFVAIFKRISQIMIALFLERDKSSKSIKDFIVIFLLVATAVIMFIRT